MGVVGLLILASLLTLGLPLPWRAASTGFLLAAVVESVRAWRTARPAGAGPALAPMLGLAAALVTLTGLTLVALFATWPLEQARQDCLDSAITSSAKVACEQAFQDDLQEWGRRLGGLPTAP